MVEADPAEETEMAAAREPMVVTHEGGLRFVADIRGHRLVVDQPAPKGEDSAPMPVELMGAALGTCVALYVQQYCASRELPYEGMRVEVRHENAKSPHRIGAFAVQVFLPEPLAAEHLEMLDRVARSCPVHNTLTHAPQVEVVIEAGAPAGV
jgi:putative redox protein